ncbi:MAG: hypothetical protein QM758_01335 [Armatimonas sp.]
MQTVVGAYSTTDEAERASQALTAAGVPWDDISLVANNEGGRYAPVTERTDDTTVGQDAAQGAKWGAGIGFLVGLTGLAIPGLGWIASAGWFLGTLLGAGTGALVGGLIGALTSVGVPEVDAQRYNEAVQSGNALLVVRASDERAPAVAQTLNSAGAINVHNE